MYEVSRTLEAVKVAGLIMSYPRQTLDGFWTALDGSAQVLRGGAGAMARDGWAASLVAGCSGRKLVQSCQVKLDPR